MALAAPVARPGVLLHDAPRPLPGRPDPEDLARVPVPAQRAAGRADPPLPATSGTGLSFGGARTPPFPSPVIIVVSGPPNAVAPRPGEEDAWSPGGRPPSREAPPRHPASGMVNAATTSSKAVARARPPDRPAAVTPPEMRERQGTCVPRPTIKAVAISPGASSPSAVTYAPPRGPPFAAPAFGLLVAVYLAHPAEDSPAGGVAEPDTRKVLQALLDMVNPPVMVPLEPRSTRPVGRDPGRAIFLGEIV